MGISIQYPPQFGKAQESKYKNLDLNSVLFFDDSGNKTELSLEPITFENGDLPISNIELTELSYGPADFNTTPECDNFPEGGFTSGDIMIKKCDELNVDSHKVAIITEGITAAGYDNSEDGKRAILQTKKGLWVLIAPVQDLTSIVKSLQYI